MSTAPVVVTRDGAVATVLLNRPEKRNALDSRTIDGLHTAFAELEHEDDVRVIVLTGAGPDFCAGADLAQLQRIAAGAGPIENLRDAERLGNLMVRMRRCSKPIIAAVRGNAIAGGAGLAGACDIVIAASDAYFGYPEVQLGFVPAMVMALLRRTVGEKAAFELVARGDRIGAHDAQRVGLVTRLVSSESFEDDVARYAQELARRSPSALALTKRLFYGIDGLAFDEAIARGAEVNALARSTEDCRAGVTQFLQRQRGT
jgi:methylglutaconyl-CoA hydratase